MTTDKLAPAPPTLLADLSRVRVTVQEITASLRSQREILQKREISLPPLVMEVLERIDKEIEALESRLVLEQTELGQLRSLADNAALINSSFDLDYVLNNAMDVIINLTGAERGYIVLLDPATSELDYRVIRENDLSPAVRTRPGEQPVISQTVIREVLESGQSMLADNAYKDERYQGNNSIASLSLRSVLCVPLNYRGRILGVVYVDNRLRSGVFDDSERSLLGAFANQAAVAIQNARLYTDIQRALNEITSVKELIDNVFESIASGVITTDARNRIMTFNRAAAAILSRPDRDAVIGQDLAALLAGISADFTAYLQHVRESEESQVISAEIKVEELRRIYLNLKLSPLKDAENRTRGVAMVLDDLTEQRERHETIDVMRRYLPPEMVDNIHSIATLDLGGERRELTCVYVDVRPLDTLPQGMRPQQIMETVNVYLAAASQCIHRARGIIDKYMGTEIMALFNTQLNPMDDHAAHAVEAALMIRERFTELYRELGIDPQPHFYRIGMHTGVATLGNVGSLNRRDFTAIGDTINLSKRLEENAHKGQIIISEATLNHLEAHKSDGLLALASLRAEERDPIKAKGRQQYTRIFEVFRQ